MYNPNPPAGVLLYHFVQGLGVRFSEASAVSLAKRVADTQAVVELMNNVFRHSECGPLRAETVLRSCRAQVCVCVFEHVI